jgi:hypothetical protein
MKQPAGVLTLIASVILTSCSTVTIRPDGGRKDTRPSAVEERQEFWLWGLVGEAHVDVRKACGDKAVDQMQAVYSGKDVLLNVVTLGIYAPRSARIWCRS